MTLDVAGRAGVIVSTEVEVDVKLLKLGITPRLDGQDLEHARALSLRFDDWPPILVERSTSNVIDGVHRVLAARMLGRRTIAARFFEGTHDEAFVEAVRSNIVHGKPLTLADREAAAKRLLRMHAEWSNRWVGEVCGLSDKTVGRLRATTADIPQLSTRVGRDGRHRPTDARPLRNQIAAALQARPDAKPEELAQALSTSPATVRDVRRRLEGGESPNGPQRATRGAGSDRAVSYSPGTERRAMNVPVNWRVDRAILALPGGSDLAEWLDQTTIRPSNWEVLVEQIPLGRMPHLIEDARARAVEWNNFAAALEARFRKLNRRSSGSEN